MDATSWVKDTSKGSAAGYLPRLGDEDMVAAAEVAAALIPNET
jgi:hypothetical protein